MGAYDHGYSPGDQRLGDHAGLAFADDSLPVLIERNPAVEQAIGFGVGFILVPVGSLLLGPYDDEGLLHHVGFTANIKAADRPALTKKLEKLIQPPGFTGQAPGGPSRWSTKRSSEWQPLAPQLVVEVAYDHFTAGRFRHGTSFLRWRPDKAPRQCTLDQVEHRGAGPLRLLERAI